MSMTFAFENRSRTASASPASTVPVRRVTSGNQVALRRLAVQRRCSACENEDKGGATHRKATDSSASEAALDAVHSVLGGSGRPLDPESRAFMEPRFGQDFSGVRIHTGADADAAARSIDARAFTSGSNVVFGAGEYSPTTDAGRRLLSHELTHVVQQSSGLALRSGVGPSNDVHERQADQVAEAIAAGGSAFGLPRTAGSHSAAGAAAIQRQTPPLAPITPQPAPPTAAPAPPAPAPTPTCAPTFTIADDIYKAMLGAWNRSGHGNAKVQERGGRIVTDKNSKRQFRPGTGTSGTLAWPTPVAGDTTEAIYHTHPYSSGEGSHLGVGFSGADVRNVIDGTLGTTSYVAAGTCNFAMNVIDTAARDTCKPVDTTKRWNDAFAAASGTMQQKADIAVKAALAGCGVCYYRGCRTDAKSNAPKVLNLL